MPSLQDAPFAKVRATRAHELIVEQLQQLILSGRLQPGSRLPSERELMLQFEVSRPTVREALRVAESMGLISVRPGDPGGPKVLGAPGVGIARVFDSLLQAGCTSPLELIQLRMLIDSSAAASACAQPRERLAPIAEAFKKMQTAADLREFVSLDVQFHEAMIAAGGNRLFLVVFQSLTEPVQALIERSLTYSHEQSRNQTLLHHEAILYAVKHRDARAAVHAVRTHLTETYSVLLSARENLELKAFVKTTQAAC